MRKCTQIRVGSARAAGSAPETAARKERSSGALGSKAWKKGGSGRSSLLEEFRATHGKTRAWELSEICGQIVSFCQDQHGSRYIQQRLETAGDDEKQVIFVEVLPRAPELMIDVFGNYVIQKLFEHGQYNGCVGTHALGRGLCCAPSDTRSAAAGTTA